MRADNKRIIETKRRTTELLLSQCIVDVIITPGSQEKVKLCLKSPLRKAGKPRNSLEKSTKCPTLAMLKNDE